MRTSPPSASNEVFPATCGSIPGTITPSLRGPRIRIPFFLAFERRERERVRGQRPPSTRNEMGSSRHFSSVFRSSGPFPAKNSVSGTEEEDTGNESSGKGTCGTDCKTLKLFWSTPQKKANSPLSGSRAIVSITLFLSGKPKTMGRANRYSPSEKRNKCENP